MRALYYITDKGIKFLQQWLSQKTDQTNYRNEFLLKLFFSNQAEQTPWWVYLIFAYLLSRGIAASKNSAIIAFILTLIISRKDLLRGVVLEIGGAAFFALMIILD